MSFDMLDLPQGFNQTVSLFPLSSAVLFPGLVQVLHVFEPRYIQLTEDALRGDRLITRALIKREQAMPPPTLSADEIFPMVCVGRIISHTRLEGGEYNLILVGICRARITGEIDNNANGKLYRQAVVELPSETACLSASDSVVRKQILEDLASALSEQSADVQGILKHLQDTDLPLGQMLDWIAHACGQTANQQQRVLNETDLGIRVDRVREIIATIANGQTRPGIQFPPKFSLN